MKKTFISALLLVVFTTALTACEFIGQTIYTVSFYNGETLMMTQEVKKGEEVTFPVDAPTKDSDEDFDYIFKGWGTEPDAEDAVEEPVVATGDMNFYALFSAKEKGEQKKTYFTVTFKDGVTGENIGEPQQVEAGGDAVLPIAPDHTDDGYKFVRWSASHINIRRTMTITAEYEKVDESSTIYTLTRHYLGQTRAESLRAGGEISLDSPTIPQAFVFGGWFFDEGLTEPVEGTMPASDEDIYAKIEVDFASAELTADGELKYGNSNEISVSGLVGVDILTYSYSWSDDSTDESINLMSAGEHEVSVVVTATYSVLGETVLSDEKEITDTFTVAKAALKAKLSADGSTFVYGSVPTVNVDFEGIIEGDTKQNIDYKYNYSVKSGDGVVAVPNSEWDRLSVGEYTVSLSCNALNYTVSTANELNFSVTPKPITATVSAQDFTYGDDLNGEVLPKVVLDESRLEYEDKASDLALSIKFKLENEKDYTPQGVFDAGTYYATIEGTLSDNYTVNKDSKQFTVAKRNITITASATNVTYGNAPALTYTTDKEFLERDKNSLKLLNKITKEDKEFKLEGIYYPAGDYSFEISFDTDFASKNYDITSNAATFTVSKAQLNATFTLADTSLTYGQKPAPSLTFGGFADGEDKSALTGEETYVYKKEENNYSSDKFEVGSYTVTAPTYTADNYDIEYDHNSLEFSVGKKTLTATVSLDNDTLTYGETPNGNITYSGFEYNEGESDIGNPQIVYKKDGTETSEFNVGQYIATIKNQSSENYEIKITDATLTINKANLTVSVEGAKETYTFGDSVILTAKFEGFVNDENAEKVFNSQSLTVNIYKNDENTKAELPNYEFYNVGTYTAKVEGLEADNYEIQINNVSFTIVKFNVTIAPTAANVNWEKGWEYKPEIVGADEKFNGFEFATKIKLETQEQGTYNADSNETFTQNHFKWVNDNDETDSDSFKIVYNKDGENTDVSGNFSVTYNITVTLNNSNFVVEVPESSKTNITFDDKEHEFEVKAHSKIEDQEIEPKIEYKVEARNGLLQASNGYSTTVPKLKNAGEYTVYYRVTAEHYDELTGNFTVTIAKATNSITTELHNENYTYDGTDHTYILSATSTFGTVTISTSGAPTIRAISGVDRLIVHNAGSYTITLTVDGTDNYDTVSQTITITVDKADYTVSGDENQSYTYNGQTQGKGITVKGVDSDEAPEVKYSLGGVKFVALRSDKKLANAGIYTVNYNVDGGENYNDVSGSFTITINKKRLTVNEDNTTATYGTQITFPEVRGLEYGDNNVTKTVKYKPFNGSETDFDETQTSDAGTYTVTYTISGDNYTFDGSASKTVTITINKANGTLTRKSDKELPEYTYTGEQQTINLTDYFEKTGDGEITFSDNTFTDVPHDGKLTVTVNLSATNNYNGTTQSVDITINKAEYEGIETPTIEQQYMGFAPDGALKALKNISFDIENWHWKDESTVVTVGSNTATAVYYESEKRNNYVDHEEQITFTAIKDTIYVTAGIGEQNFDTGSQSITQDMFNIKFLHHDKSELSDWEKYFTVSLTNEINFQIGGTYLVTIKVNIKEQASECFELHETSVQTAYKIKSVDLNGTLYTIEDAINNANDGDTVIVKHNTSFTTLSDDITGYLNDCRTVKSGVTLFVPCDNKNTALVKETKDYETLFDGNGLYCTLYIPVSLTVNGKFHINGARINKGNDTARTEKSKGYAEVKIEKDKTVTLNDGAEFVCYGYVYGEGVIDALSGSTVKEPFAMGGYKGGTITSKIYSKVFPVNQYAFANIICHTKIHKGASYIVQATLSGKLFLTIYKDEELKFIGNDSSNFVELNGEDSFMEKYVNEQNGNIYLEANGELSFHNLSVTAAGITMDTSGKQVPIPGNFRLAIKSGTATIPSEVSIKLLPGAELAIEESATLKVEGSLYGYGNSSHIVYSDGPSKWQDGNNGMAYPAATVKSAYRTTPTLSYSVDTAAKITVSGTLEVSGTIGADITGSGSGKVEFSGTNNGTITEDYANSQGGNTFTATITSYLSNNDGITFTSLESGTYTYNGSAWTKQE